jgi:hypothetical protein
MPSGRGGCQEVRVERGARCRPRESCCLEFVVTARPAVGGYAASPKGMVKLHLTRLQPLHLFQESDGSSLCSKELQLKGERHE